MTIKHRTQSVLCECFKGERKVRLPCVLLCGIDAGLLEQAVDRVGGVGGREGQARVNALVAASARP